MPDGVIAKKPEAVSDQDRAAQAPLDQAPSDKAPSDKVPVDKDWRNEGIKVVRAGARSCDTPDTMGMNRQVALSGGRTGASRLWAGTNHLKPGHPTGPHHHGALESVIYVVSGRAIMRWGNRLEFITEAGPGDFLQVPPFMPHQELNASDTEDLHCVLVRSGTEEVVVNLDDLDIVAEPEWIRFD